MEKDPVIDFSGFTFTYFAQKYPTTPGSEPQNQQRREDPDRRPKRKREKHDRELSERTHPLFF